MPGGTGSLFPTSSYNASNYWVDVLCKQGAQNTAPVAANDSGFTRQTQARLLPSRPRHSLPMTAMPMAIRSRSPGSAVRSTARFPSTARRRPSLSRRRRDIRGRRASAMPLPTGRAAPHQHEVSLAVNNPSCRTGAERLCRQCDTLGHLCQRQSAGQSRHEIRGRYGRLDHRHPLLQGGPTIQARTTAICGRHRALCSAASPSTTRRPAAGETAQLTQQVAIQADTTYVVSYSTNGNYSATGNYFGSEVTNGDLKALAGNNGVYAYGSGGLFPTSSYNSTNYYVDAAFKPQLAA